MTRRVGAAAALVAVALGASSCSGGAASSGGSTTSSGSGPSTSTTGGSTTSTTANAYAPSTNGAANGDLTNALTEVAALYQTDNQTFGGDVGQQLGANVPEFGWTTGACTSSAATGSGSCIATRSTTTPPWATRRPWSSPTARRPVCAGTRW